MNRSADSKARKSGKASDPYAKSSRHKSGAQSSHRAGKGHSRDARRDRGGQRSFKHAPHKAGSRHSQTWIGTLSAHPDGYGFVAVEGREEDIFLPRSEMHELMHGDEVEVRTVRKRGRESGELVRIVKQASPIIVAQLANQGGLIMALPRSRRFSMPIMVHRRGLNDAKPGDWVRLELKRGGASLHASVLEVLGQSLTPQSLIDLVIAEQELEPDFYPEVLAQVSKIPDQVQPEDMQDRQDLRSLNFVTIDGEDARDFDDAICVRPRGEGFEAWVAIADVAHYVKEGTPLDQQAQARGNSFYFPDRVIPMLPEKLSNGLCSLNPDVPRLAMTVRMRFDAVGKRRSVQVHESVIHSKARLTYTQVAKYLEEGESSAIENEEVRQMLTVAHRLFDKLHRKREIRGALDLDLPEVRAQVQDGQLQGMVPLQRNSAHMLIEEMMLAANTAVAEYLEQNQATFLYRVHPEPEVEAIEKLNTYLVPKGKFISIKKAGGKSRGKSGGQASDKSSKPSRIDPRDVQEVLQSSYGKSYAHVLHRLILRSMQQAFYTSHKQGHFGLAYQAYGHFTSPIRRYADLTVHRCLKGILRHKKYHVDQEKIEEVAQHISKQERKQQRAEWDTQAMLAALYHQKDVGQEMDAVISGLTSRRIFVELDETLAEGACDVDDLAGRFTLDDAGHALIANRGGYSIELGDKVRVRLDATDPVRGQIKVSLLQDKQDA